MKPHDRRPESGMRDRWMVSYMDVLTILLIFFVAVAAKSLMRPKNPPVLASPVVVQPAAAVPPVLTPQPPVAERAGLEEIQRKLERQVLKRQDQDMDAPLDVKMEPRGLVISLPQAILFRPGRDKIDAAALPVVYQIAEVLRQTPNKVSLIGHADPVPIHNRRFRSNWELAAARGLRLLELLTTRYGIAESRLSTASYGSVDPTSPNDTAAGRASNRRVEIVILDAAPPPGGP